MVSIVVDRSGLRRFVGGETRQDVSGVVDLAVSCLDLMADGG
jgi:hypothetical protein